MALREAVPSAVPGTSARQAVAELRNLGCALGSDLFVVIESLTLFAGDVLVLDAPSGTGKSTVLGLMAGIIPAADLQGRVQRMFGRDLADPSRPFAPPTAAELGFVLQTSTLIPYLSLAENIDLPAAIARCTVAADWRAQLIRQLGIETLLRRMPHQVSVGQRQRAAIARAMLARPRLLLMDEPVSALDPSNVRRVETLILDLARQAGAAVVLASHQVDRSAFAAERRAAHRVVHHQGVAYSLFHDAEGRA
ncbi:MAG: ABC transporter ATP-binding protein [Rhodobacteraceae bacterium PARR1]|nr:MAG: ABC transporter ATP-binding protein [Rhodobacteraceae bacterium PARR1]